MKVKKGTTDVTSYFKLIDPSTGVPETALVITNLDLSYVRDLRDAVKADATELATTTSAHSDNTMKEIDATNTPGLYRADWPDLAFANSSGVEKVQLCVNGAAIDPAYIEVELEDAIIKVDVDAIRTNTQTAIDLADFADAGYDPATNSIEIVKLVSTTSVNTDMRGTDGANTTVPDAAGVAPTAVENRQEMDSNSTRLSAIETDVTGINGDAMRGTDSAALAATALTNATWTDARAGYLDNINGHTAQTGDSFARIGATGSGLTSLAQASVLGAINDAAAADDPTNADTLMQYIKQVINILVGTDGIATFPAEAAPANAVSLAEVIRAIHADVTGLNGSVMRGTDSAALAATALTNVTWTDAKAAFIDVAISSRNSTTPDAAGTAAGLHATTDGLINALNDFDPANDAVANVTLVTTVTTNTDMRGTDNAALASVATEGRLAELDAANLPADVDSIKAQTDSQPAGIKKNVALSNFYFTMILASDDVTPGTGLTITGQISKDGGAYAGVTNNATIAEVGNGDYTVDLTQTEMNADTIALRFTAATANETKIQIKTSA